MDNRANDAAAHLPLLQYQPLIAYLGMPVQRHTKFLDLAYKIGWALGSATVRVYTDRFRDPVVARAGRDTYRTFLLREMPRSAEAPRDATRDSSDWRALRVQRSASSTNPWWPPKPRTPTTTRWKPSTARALRH